jgi:hypothetical protein
MDRTNEGSGSAQLRETSTKMNTKVKPRKVFDEEYSPLEELLAQRKKSTNKIKSSHTNRYCEALDHLVKTQ